MPPDGETVKYLVRPCWVIETDIVSVVIEYILISIMPEESGIKVFVCPFTR